MELFIPTLVVLVLSALVCFFILPRLSPYILGLLSLGMLVIGIWQNYKMFPQDYSAISNVYKEYSGFALTLLVILLAIVGITYIGNKHTSMVSIIPEIPLPNLTGSNTNKSIFNLGGTSSPMGSITGAVNSAVTSVNNALKSPVSILNNSRKNKPLGSNTFSVV
jgi:hypothetical protein